MASLDSCDDLNCNPTCQTKILPGTREETDGAMVWAVIFATLVVIAFLLAAGRALLRMNVFLLLRTDTLVVCTCSLHSAKEDRC